MRLICIHTNIYGSGSEADLYPYKNIYGSGTTRSKNLRIPRILDLEHCLKPLAEFSNYMYYPLSLPGRRHVDSDLGAHTPRRIFDAVGGIPSTPIVTSLFLLGSHLHKDTAMIK
jgi:hypothetical protein